MSPRTPPRRARPLARWAGRIAGLVRRPTDVPAARPPERHDPLVYPAPLTGHCVIGDQIRVPAAWCDIAGCGARFADPAALGEADKRVRAVAAGWCAEAVGQLVCPACQQRNGVVRRLPGQEPGTCGSPTPAAAPPGPPGRSVRPIIAGWHNAISTGRHRRAPWPHLLTALANDRNGWSAPQPVPGPGRRTGLAGDPAVGQAAARHTGAIGQPG